MSRSKRFMNYKTREYFFYRHNTLDDLVSRTKNYTYEFKSLSSLLFKRRRKGQMFLPNEVVAKAKAKTIAKDLFDMIADDLIMECDILTFPKAPFGYMKVSDMTSAHPKYSNTKFNFKTEGKYYEGRLMLDRAIQRLNKKHFRFRFSRPQRKKLDAQLEKGIRY